MAHLVLVIIVVRGRQFCLVFGSVFLRFQDLEALLVLTCKTA